jgi:hypothetical protein
MAKRGPKPKDKKKKTGVVRVAPDMAVMIAALCRHLGKTTSELMDEIARRDVEVAFEKVKPVLQQLAKHSPVAKKTLQDTEQARAEYQAALEEEAAKRKAAE